MDINKCTISELIKRVDEYLNLANDDQTYHPRNELHLDRKEISLSLSELNRNTNDTINPNFDLLRR